MTADTSALAVVFDLEGTLLHSQKAVNRAINAATASCSWSETWTHLELRDPETTTLRAGGHLPELYAQLRTCHIDPIPGIAEALDEISAKYRIGVATNARRGIASALLDGSGLTRYFDVIVSMDDVRLPKPDPEPIHRACSKLGVSSLQTFVVGDSVSDLAAATAAGARGVHVGWGNPNSRMGNSVTDPSKLFEFIEFNANRLVHSLN